MSEPTEEQIGEWAERIHATALPNTDDTVSMDFDEVEAVLREAFRAGAGSVVGIDGFSRQERDFLIDTLEDGVDHNTAEAGRIRGPSVDKLTALLKQDPVPAKPTRQALAMRALHLGNPCHVELHGNKWHTWVGEGYLDTLFSGFFEDEDAAIAAALDALNRFARKP